MTKLEKVNTIPVSGESEEVIFDLPDSCQGQEWNFVKFTLPDDINWYGHFREKYFKGSFCQAVLPEKGIACIVSGGHGIIIDILKREKLIDIDIPRIVDIYADNETNTFYVSNWQSLHFIDEKLSVIKMPIPVTFTFDGILFKKVNRRKLYFEFEYPNTAYVKNHDYYIDLDTKEIKKSNL
ncbi:hypothetical protein [uncultured Draconibacterium sp.]|uniref:hypothetical protein n=1 Tax=uncultured Draconibacterium sp. TaxID=1573823 RepID=UPI002AA90FDA|nr:hypothetical protein [uncultured Draconibacterium sp.]